MYTKTAFCLQRERHTDREKATSTDRIHKKKHTVVPLNDAVLGGQWIRPMIYRG